MNLRNKMRKFFTLSRRHEAGFTLVELIVVIAILAILGGVAVPVYSGYVKKANMAADESLVAEIENALMLAMYSDPFENPSAGILVLSVEGEVTLNGSPIEEGSEVDLALEKAFGENYRDTLKLTYDGWTAADHLNFLTSDLATIVKGSSYISGLREDSLLSDVEKFTNMAHRISGINGKTLASMYDPDLLKATAEKYNIQGPADDDWDAWHAAHPQEFANLVVLATAKDINDLAEENIEEEDLSSGTGYVTAFTQLYGFAATCPEFSDVLTQYMDAMNAGTATTITRADGSSVTINPVVDATTGADWWRSLQMEAERAEYENAAGLTFENYQTSDANEADVLTFQTIMMALSATPAEGISSDLGNGTLFTEGAVKDMYDQYIGTVEALAHTTDFEGLNLKNGEVAVIYVQNSMEVMNTIS